MSCLLSLLKMMSELHFHHLLNNFHSKDELKVKNHKKYIDIIQRKKLMLKNSVAMEQACIHCDNIPMKLQLTKILTHETK